MLWYKVDPRFTMPLLVFLAVLFACASTFAQTTPPAASNDALGTLNQVAQKYADAKSLHIEAAQEILSYNDLRRYWEKTIMSSTVGPDGRYRYEGRTGTGAALIVSDGKTVWTYHANEKLYTETAVAAGKPAGPRVIEMEDEPAQRAKHLRRDLADLTKHLTGAQFLPEETLTIDGVQRRCIVIHYGPEDVKQDLPPEYLSLAGKEQGILWIDKEHMTLVKKVRQADAFIRAPGSSARIPMRDETTITFSVVELNIPVPDSTFVFIPSADAKLVDEFPAQKKFEKQQGPRIAAERSANTEMIGKAAPDLELKAADGKVVRLSSFRGKPVLIDVWATWCGPCVAMIPEMKKLNNELTARGAVLLTVDRDEDATTATAFLKREQVEWQNFHDIDDAVRTAFHAMNGVPWQVMIDSEGKVAFYHPGEDVEELRIAIAKLGPQYGSVAPNPEPKKHEQQSE